MITENLFEIVTHKIHISDWQQHKNRILSLVPFNSEEYTKDPSLSYGDFYHQNRGSNLPYSSELLDVIKPHLTDLEKLYTIHDYGKPWCQGYLQSDWHSPHNHGSEGLSCIFYAHYDSKVHRPTEYISPFPSIYGNIATKILEVEEGDLVVFPSFLLHVAPPSGSDKSRIIFAFNMKADNL